MTAKARRRAYVAGWVSWFLLVNAILALAVLG
jgi:hypothetical protein